MKVVLQFILLVVCLIQLKSTLGGRIFDKRPPLIFRPKRDANNYNVNVQLIVGDGNVQGINSNGASGGSLAQQCFTCICGKDGPCSISWAYWADAGRPTVGSDKPFEDNAFTNCRGNHNCAKRAVESYVQKFSRDCNGDGRIDCKDYAAIHRYGGFGGCTGKSNYLC